MAHFVKVFDSIIHSTIWQEPLHVKVVWITMLALADSRGEVQASIPGLAKASGVTIQQCEEALKVFLSPDPYSRSKVAEGRRIEEISGGWELINYKHYRDMKSAEQERENAAIRQARHRQRIRDNNGCHEMSRDVTKSNHIVEVEEEVEEKKELPPKPPKGGTRVRRPRTPKDVKPSLLDQIPAENLIHAVNQIINLTPMTDLSGRPIRVVAAELLERVQARLSEHPSATPAIMVEAWADYLATNPQCLKAPQYFFGKKEDQKGGELSANWYEYAKAIFVRNHKKQQEGK